MPLMGSLYVGTSGLKSSQNALNTTAHNLSNMDTKGYTRQQVLFGDRDYNTLSRNVGGVSYKQVGLGVQYSKVRQVRDGFLDKTYRRESGRSAFYEVSTNALSEVEDLLGELNGKSFSEAMDEMWGAIQEMAKEPSAVTKGLLVHKASAFIERANKVYQGFIDYQDNLNLQIKKQVDQINEYGKKIKELNDSIRKIQVGGIEAPNDLKDARNQILDELSKMANISYKEDVYGTVTVKLEGVDFVNGDMAYEMGLDVDSETGFYTPFWTHHASYTYDERGNKVYDATGADVFQLNQEISTDQNTDIGGLKAMILARGDHRANYTDLNADTYNTSGVSQSIIMNVQAEFDQLIHIVTTKMNEILRKAADPSTGYLCDSKGNPIELFTRTGTESYDTSTNPPTYIGEDASRTETLFTVMNLKINPELEKEPSKLDFIKPDEKEDRETLNALKDAFEANDYTLNPNVKTSCNFTDYYSNLESQVGNSGQVYYNLYVHQDSTVNSIENARQQVAGVSQDEELSNMVKFQSAYNASSRYINVVNEMLEHLLQKLG